LLDLLDTLTQALTVSDKDTWHVTLRSSSTAVSKRFEAYLDFRKSQIGQSKKDQEHYQQAILKRLKMVSMIGGQLYKRIIERSNSKK
jgi:hypothetical protein